MSQSSNITYVRRAGERGHVNLGWLSSHHSFSFGHYYDPGHMGISALRVINDDTVVAGAGFGTHGHSDMEIISYVLDGALKHQDSMGHEQILSAGEVQHMSAGRGITHSEYNASGTEPVRFLQIWIQPRAQGIEPGYEQACIPQHGALTPLVTADGRDGSLVMQQDASLYRLVLAAGESMVLTSADGPGYLHLISGELLVDGGRFTDGDALAIAPDSQLPVSASRPLEALWFELPARP
ncbi:pirin family protein [Shewanella sp. GXUN23E]|uniref:pirin family protein n=1 Tax=Shewanella sp. GXUN23E TaxID=3422498 RepID=UPI003D7CF2A2